MLLNPTPRQLSAIKAALFALCLVPALLLTYRLLSDDLGANPIEALTRQTGEWTLRFLFITLAVTPLRRLTGWHWLIRLRRMLGLAAFCYACVHLTTYVWLDKFFDWQDIAHDIIKRPFITVGMSAFALLLPLAATSNNHAIRRLGGRRWQALHRTVYAIAILGVVHFWFLVKKDVTEPFIYALILAALLGVRVWWREQERRARLAGACLPRPQLKGRRVIQIVQK
ncbi:MAG: sulfoxide reductase heme-binding subunit YedZ [Zoogloea sp.]|nr:sulfoxide reductase heme-binding subunit YedZ [Zoogloea sp.]